MNRNPFADDTTVTTPASMRIKVVSIDGDRVCLAQEVVDAQGHSVTLVQQDCTLRAGDTMTLRDITLTLTFDLEKPK